MNVKDMSQQHMQRETIESSSGLCRMILQNVALVPSDWSIHCAGTDSEQWFRMLVPSDWSIHCAGRDSEQWFRMLVPSDWSIHCAGRDSEHWSWRD